MLVDSWHFSGICSFLILVLSEYKVFTQHPVNRNTDPGCYIFLPNLWSFWPNSVYIESHWVPGTVTSGVKEYILSQMFLYCNPFRDTIQVLQLYHIVGTYPSRPKILGSSDPFKIQICSTGHSNFSSCGSLFCIDREILFQVSGMFKKFCRVNVFHNCKYSNLKLRVWCGVQSSATDSHH